MKPPEKPKILKDSAKDLPKQAITKLNKIFIFKSLAQTPE